MAIAAWQVSRGRGDESPFAHIPLTDAPSDIQRHVRQLAAVTYQSLLYPAGRAASENVPLAAIMAELTERERAILLERVLADRQTTLQVLGQRFGVSHQRIAQLEREFRAKVAENLAPGTYFGELVRNLVKLVGPFAPLSVLLARAPGMGEYVPGTTTPVWVLVDKLCDGVEIKGGWVAVPSIAEVVRASRQWVREMEVAPGVSVIGVQRDIWEFNDDHVAAWARLCGYIPYQDFLIDPATHVADALEQALLTSSGPQSVDALGHQLAAVGERRSAATVMAALREDERFVRTGSGWTLRHRPPTYADVIADLRRRVTEQGSISLAEAVEAGAALGASADAVNVYARTGWFTTTDDGRVRLAEHPLPLAFTPAESPGLYRVDGGWGQVVTITQQDLELDSVQVSSGVGVLLGITPPGRVDLPSLPGAHVTWNVPHVRVTLPTESLRPYRPGDRLLLWFGFGSFQVRPLPPRTDGLVGVAAALDDLGLPFSGDPDADLRALASALDLPPGSDLRRIREACRRKREWTALAAVDALDRP